MDNLQLTLDGFQMPEFDRSQIDLNSYDKILVCFSGGKDGLACLLSLLDQGVDKDRLEIWHHEIDGRENSQLKMDWPVTRAYCEAVAKAFDIPCFFSWKQGGFEREMNRDNALTAPTCFETPDEGVQTVGGDRGKPNTRLKFPMVTADLSRRWCSSYLKISPCESAIRNQARFEYARTLVVTGERAEESASRAKYSMFEPHRSDNRAGKSRRHVDHYRPVHDWSEAEVWDIIKKYKVNPHPAYRVGMSRCSCMTCIFSSKDQWATVKEIAPERFEQIATLEETLGYTIQIKEGVRELAAKGAPYEGITEQARALAMSEEFNEPVFLDVWSLPSGAFGEGGGPT